MFFQNDNINTLEGDSELRLVIMSGIAQDEVRKLSERLKFGFRQAIKNGHVLGNDKLYGYNKKGCVLTIYEAEAEWQTNLSIYFCSQQELVDRMGEQHYGNDGAVTFWYTDNIIYDEIICIRSDLDQTLRNSVILEEIYNGLGPVQDTDLRSESIIYSGFSQPQALHPIDRVIIQLLYHPSLSCGMDAAECEEAILALYY